MSTATVTPTVVPDRPTFAPIPFSRIVSVELRKMFDTRSGFWLLAGIGILAVLATAAVVAFAPDDQMTYETFASAIGVPMTVLLPVVAVLSVTSEWSQRTGLTTFTFVPGRGRVIAAKALCSIGVGVVSIALAAAVGALGNVVGTAIAGVDTVWDVAPLDLLLIVLANVLSLMVGFTLGTVLRSSAAAIVGYFVFGFVLFGLTSALAAAQDWFADLQPWVDFNYAQGALFEGAPSAEQWAQLGTSGLLWIALPLAVGLRLVLRSEVK